MRYIIGIGTNLGNRLLNIRRAIKHLSSNNEITITNTSSIYESNPQLPSQYPGHWYKQYFNLAILIEFNGSPKKLLSSLKLIELKIGRKEKYEKWSPRVIDLDILIAEYLNYNDHSLTIPHVEFFNRDFALLPAVEIVPNILQSRAVFYQNNIIK